MTRKAIDEINFDPGIYPRQKWSTATIGRFVDALKAGDGFPPIVLEKGTDLILDGVHRYKSEQNYIEEYEKAGIEDKVGWPKPDGKIGIEYRSVPEGQSAKYFAATLSSRHGDRLSNSDCKNLALIEFDSEMYEDEDDWKMPDARTWGKGLGISESTIYDWVSHLINRARADRQTKAWRLSQLGWTQQEIAERLESKQRTISDDLSENSEIGKIAIFLGKNWNAQSVTSWSNRMNIPLTDSTAAAIKDFNDDERLKFLDIKIRPYDVWNFSSCHDLMGDKYPGRIPGELICHVLWCWTKQGDLVIDPMAGSGTTLDACLLMGRKSRGYEIDQGHGRVDIEQNNLENGWPDKAAKANLIFWDPPYWDKKDSEYIEGSISGLSKREYLKFFDKSFKSLKSTVKPGTILAFLISDWNDNENKEQGIFVWDYVNLLLNHGWRIVRHIQAPLPSQQIHPDIINKFRKSRKLARLGRSLIIARA